MLQIKRISVFLTILLSTTSCFVFKVGVINETFHNTTAHYNAYYIAKENIKQVENSINDQQDYNYNKVLPILPVIDSAMIDSKDEEIEKVIRMASIAIQRHKISKWVDDSYLLIGRARYYQADFPNAIQTFKYINSKSEDDNTRHLALTYLIRTFVDAGEINNGISVIDYLKREKLNRKNTKRMHLQSAYLYCQRSDEELVMENLEKAAPLMKKSEGRAKIYFILGQIYQEKGNDSLAFYNYTQCLKSKPAYVLSFYSKLYMAQVTDLKNETDIKQIRKYFEKLLADDKNEEFRDKIYYEMAGFEMKQGNLERAIDYYKQSTRVSENNDRQKSYGYLKLGQIYYDQKKDFNLAKAYYDSVLTVMPSDEPNYEDIKERSEILTEFVKHYTIIKEQDSLLYLASLDSTTLFTLFNDDYQEQKKQQKIEERKNRRQEYLASAGGGGSLVQDEGFSLNQVADGEWYFYSDASVSRGQDEFNRNWGNRPLTDYWRVSSMAKTQEVDESVEKSGKEDESDKGEVQAASNNKSLELSEEDELKREFSNFLEGLPFSDEAKLEANIKIENAMYNLGNIYNFQLEEKENAEETFTDFINRFDTSQYRPEVLYLLYLIRKGLNMSGFVYPRNEVLDKYPESIFAKLIENPNYREESIAANEKARQLYEKAYRFYNTAQFDSVFYLRDQVMTEFPETKWVDYFKILAIRIIGLQEGVFKYQYELDQFIENNPESELIQYANKLRGASEDYQAFLKRIDAVRFIQELTQTHFFVILYEDKKLSEELPEIIKSYAHKTLNMPNLRVGNLILNDNTSMILINEFSGGSAAMEFYKKFNGETYPLYQYPSSKFKNFVISKDNFQIFYQSKEIEGYMSFFNRNYPL